MLGLGVPELIIIGIIILLIFGAKRIPEIGKGIGGAIREFRNIGKELRGSEPKKIKSKETKSSETKSKDDNSKEFLSEGKESYQSSIEAKVAKKVLEKVPGARKVMEINDKVNKVKEIIQ